MLSKLAACTLAAVASAQTTVKVGAVLQSTGTGSYGKVAYDAWAAWVNNQTDLGYGVSVAVKDYDSATLADAIDSFTNPSHTDKVDVLVLPYTSGASSTALGHVNAGFTGPVMVWGGASDGIFAADGPCDKKSFKCFGFFTVGSQYMGTGLAALADASADKLKVLLVQNNNGFSKSVCTGAETIIGGNAKLELLQKYSLSTAKAEPTAAELEEVAGNATEADVVAICGHNGDVEPVIKKLGEMEAPVKAIISTNSLTPTAVTSIGAKAECVMMPTQWAEAAVKDDIVGWTSADFKTAAGDAATYHGAAAAASAIMISHGMKADSTVANLAASIDGLGEVQTFYGPIDFETSGAIKKPMYTQQKMGDANFIVAPAAAEAAKMKFPLSSCPSWSSSTASTTNSDGVSAGCKTSASLALILALAFQNLAA